MKGAMRGTEVRKRRRSCLPGAHLLIQDIAAYERSLRGLRTHRTPEPRPIGPRAIGAAKHCMALRRKRSKGHGVCTGRMFRAQGPSGDWTACLHSAQGLGQSPRCARRTLRRVPYVCGGRTRAQETHEWVRARHGEGVPGRPKAKELYRYQADGMYEVCRKMRVEKLERETERRSGVLGHNL